MPIEQVLHANWENWASGGVPASALLSKLSDLEIQVLEKWASPEFVPTETESANAVKRLIDLATWVHWGTHSLTFLPREIRESRLNQAAEKLGTSAPVLQSLIAKPLPVIS